MGARVLRIIGAVWMLPVAVPIWVLYVLPFWALGWHKHVGSSGRRMVARFRVVDDAPPWLRRLWEGWAGHALPFAVVYRSVFVPRPTQRHELRHTDQWLVLGPLFPIVYVALHFVCGYRDNPLERDARAAERE